MKELVEVIAKALVENPDEVAVTLRQSVPLSKQQLPKMIKKLL